MFGQSSFGGFGQSSAAPAFGSTPSSSPFGGSTAFGSTQPSPFGASTGTGAFGASQPAFGASPTPAFGAPQSQGGMFGSTAFGAKPASGFGFGAGGTAATTPSPFGAPSQPGAFGAPASTSAFGGFGASPTSAPAFGATSTPAFGAPASAPAFSGFGASSTPAFGAPAAAAAAPSAFGTPGSAGAPSPFGAPGGAPAFGTPAATQQQQPNMGSRVMPYQKHQDKDTSSSSSSTAPTTVYYSTITAMPAYLGKSTEELRWEDYQANVKNQNSAPAPAAAPAATGGFGAAAAPAVGGFGFGASTGGAFGLGQSSASPFGASSSPGFGASSPSPFGGAGGFGSTPAASTPAFGAFGAAASTPATGTGFFGAATSQPATGGFGFGAASTPAFGAASSASAFGGSSAPSLFGGSTFGASSGGALFGGSSTPAFGAATSSPSLFGASSAPAFGTPGSSPFGASTPPQQAGAFGAPASSGFNFGTPGAAAAKPATGGFSFGSTPASGGLFAAPASTGSIFGPSSAPAFGTGGGLFGNTPASNPATGTSLFGGSTLGAAPATGGLFGTPPAAGAAPSGSAFGGFGATPTAAPVQPATVGQQPYGALQPLPQVNVPEHKVGITQRPVRAAVTSMRPSPLLTLRTSTPKFGLGTATSSYNKTPGSLSGAAAVAAAGAGGSPYSLSGGAASPAAAAADGSRIGSPAAALLLPVRENPHRLFIRTPPPSTTPAGNGSSLSPAMQRAGGTGATGAEESTPVRTPTTRRMPYHSSPSSAAAAETPAANGTAGKTAAADNGTPASSSKAAAAAAAAGGDRTDRRQYGAGAGAAGAGAVPEDAPRLGALESEGYSLEPDLQELQDLARQNPAALSRLSGFKVRREGFGCLEWQQPVDVRGLDLEALVQIERGEVSLYVNNAAEKPPVGSGLNSQCKVTLEGVYKKSKTGQQPDAAAVAAFRKRLARYCSEMGARFIDYKPEGGIWMFEVDHFSRYGLPMDSDSDGGGGDENGDECMTGGKGDEEIEPAGKATSQEAELTFGGPVYSEDADMAAAADGGDVTQQQQQHFTDDDNMGADVDEYEQQQQQQQQGLDEAAGFGSVPLQHSLPALLGHEPESLMELRGAFFRKGEAVDQLAAAAAAAVGPSASPTLENRGYGAAAGFGRRRQQQQQVLPRHNWVRPRTALLQQQERRLLAAEQQQQQITLFGDESQSGQQLQEQEQQLLAAAAAALISTPLTKRDAQKRRRSTGASAAAAAAAGAVASAATRDLLPSPVAVGNSDSLIDASLMLGRSFRVGWGPNGVLAIPQNPGLNTSSKTLAGPSVGFSITLGNDISIKPQAASGICKAEDLGVPCIELKQLSPVAAVAGSSSSRLAAFSDAERSAAAEAMQQRVLSSLELHLQYSKQVHSADGTTAAECPEAAQDADMADQEQRQQQQPDAPAGGSAQQWRLQVDRKQISGFVEQQVDWVGSAVAAAAAGSDESSSSNSSRSIVVGEIAGWGQHIKDLWQLLRVLYEYIAGEDSPHGGSSSGDTPLHSAAAAAMHEGADLADGPLVDSSSSSSRVQLAAMQRKAAISRWLQRKLKPAVEASLTALQDIGSSSGQQQQQQHDEVVLWSLLHLMIGRQIAAAAAVAVAVGDVRLATLLTAAGQAVAGLGGSHIVTQMKSWARAGILPSHISKPRRLLLALLAAAAPASTAAGSSAGGVEGLMEISDALNLDWSRAFGLWLWYGVPFTEPVAAVTTAFTAALAAATALPRPVPPHTAAAAIGKPSKGSGSVSRASSSFAAADTQYALLQLQARGAYGLSVALLDDHSSSSSSSGQGLGVDTLISKLFRVAGYSSNPLDYCTAWQLMSVLESLGALPHRRVEYESVSISIISSLINQLLLLGPAASPWTAFVALHIPNHSSWGRSCREAALQQLLQLTVQHWSKDTEGISWLRDTLQLPVRWLHETMAVYAGYCRDHNLQLLHLLAAAEWKQAHDLACSKVLPLLARAAAAAPGQGAAAATAAAFAAAAWEFLAAAGEAAAAAAQGHSSSSSRQTETWADVAYLQEDSRAAVAAAAHVAVTCTAEAGAVSRGGEDFSAGPAWSELKNPARVAAVALRALTRVFSAVSSTLGPDWTLGGGVYAAWCGVFLNPEGDTHDPAAIAAAAAAAANGTEGASAAAAAAAAGEAVERCLYLADVLAGVAAATGGSSSSWWGSPLQRLVQSRMTADVGKALIRLGVNSSMSAKQQQAPLLVPLAAAGFSSSGLGGGVLVGGQGAAQLLAGAANDVVGMLTVT